MIGFPFDLPFDRDLIRRTYEHCMKLDKRVLCMGHAFFTGDAAFVGDRKGARKLLDRIIDETLEPVWGMGTECTTATSTCFITTMGAMLQTAIMAFTGIRFEPEHWTKCDACLPEGWDRIEVGRIYLGGQAYKLEAVNGGKAVLTPIEED